MCRASTTAPRTSLDDVRASAADYRLGDRAQTPRAAVRAAGDGPPCGLPPADPKPRPIDDVYADWQRERPRHGDLRDDVEYIVDLLVAAGHDVIVVDQTSPEQRAVGLRTACVIVPGLVPIDFGWQRQRVLHMPRLRYALQRAGYRDTELPVDEINFVPHPFP